MPDVFLELNIMGNPKISWRIVLSIQILVLVTIGLTVIFTNLGIFPFDTNLGVYRLLPGGILLDFIWLYVLSFVSGAIVYFATPNFSSFLWKLHRLLTRGNYNYYVQDFKDQGDDSPRSRRMILPAFVALGISYSLSNIRSLANLIFVSESFGSLAPEAQTIVISLSLLFILLLMSCFITVLFAPMWLMQDNGLVSELKTKPRVTADIEGVGSWYLKMMKGFAGVSTLVAYIFTIYQTVEWYQYVLSSPPPGGFTMLIFLVPVMAVVTSPILALGPISLVFVLYEESLVKNLASFKERTSRAGLETVTIDLISHQEI